MAERSFKAEVEHLRLGYGDTFTGEGILAITKALLECGVGYVGGYQGAPISHLMDVLADAQDLLGELGVLTTSPRSATIRAKGRLMMLRIGTDMFLKLLAENPSVALDVMRQLSGKLVLAHRQYEELQDKMQRNGGG